MFGREGNGIRNEKRGFQAGGKEAGWAAWVWGGVDVLRARLMDPSGWVGGWTGWHPALIYSSMVPKTPSSSSSIRSRDAAW
jgi:hypothetical protein